MTYFFETYGCQMNKAESAAVEQFLVSQNWVESHFAETADLVIINTCSVRITAETRIHGRLGWYNALKKERAGIIPAGYKKIRRPLPVPVKPLTLVVMGCMAERLKDEIKKKFRVVDYVVGTFQKQHFLDILNAIKNNRTIEKIDEDAVYSFASLSYENGDFKALVPIMHGCNNFCTYCIVPYVRGREISRPLHEILQELDTLSNHGVKEITLLGQNVNSYASEGVNFPQLMEKIAQHLQSHNSSIGWIRFMSSHPKDLSDELLSVIAKNRIFCRHIHLPVQHGSNAILHAMNRKYTRENYITLVDEIHTIIPEASLSTDILVGFPGETDEDFNQTIELMQKVKFETAFMYYYNQRDGTKAFSMENQLPLELKKERLAKIVDLQHQITRSEMQKRVNSTVTVLVEAVSRDSKDELRGRTEQDERVIFAGDKNLIGTFQQIDLHGLTGSTFMGTLKRTYTR
ncbi:MAG: tRNA (N6-isopentenyl adenosine(37)-C2)-methylthiotransferase MiaB [Treponemataceae bacterium]